MPRELLPDALWTRLEPLLPGLPPQPRGGRPWKPHLACLRGILSVLHTGIQWEALPTEVFGVSGMTCWRRLRDWHAAGVWESLQQLQQLLLDELGAQGNIDWSRAALDSSSIAAKRGGALTGPNPTDRGRAGTKHHVLTDRQGLPLAESVTPAVTDRQPAS